MIQFKLFLLIAWFRQIETCRDEVCREATETPALPDLEEVISSLEEILEVELSPACPKSQECDPGEMAAEQKIINPFILANKPIIPEVMYKWMRGFRRDNSGRYCKVELNLFDIFTHRSNKIKGDYSENPVPI